MNSCSLQSVRSKESTTCANATNDPTSFYVTGENASISEITICCCVPLMLNHSAVLKENMKDDES